MIGLLVSNLLDGGLPDVDVALGECRGQYAYCVELRFYLPVDRQARRLVEQHIEDLASDSPFSMLRVVLVTPDGLDESRLGRLRRSFKPAQCEAHPLFSPPWGMRGGFRHGCEFINVSPIAGADADDADHYMPINIGKPDLKAGLMQSIALGCRGIYIHGKKPGCDVTQRFRLIHAICENRLTVLFESPEVEQQYLAMGADSKRPWPQPPLTCACLDRSGCRGGTPCALGERANGLGQRVFGDTA
jgi:hypothetical protein